MYFQEFDLPLVIGGRGFFDAVVIAGFIALGLAEIVGKLQKNHPGMEGQEDNISSIKDTEAENPEMDNYPEDNN